MKLINRILLEVGYRECGGQGSRVALLILTAMLSNIASAQISAAKDKGGAIDSGGLAEILVTANRRSENLQDVPISINAVSASQLASSGIASTADLSLRLPGINFQVNGSGFQPYIRGVGTTANSAGNENSVAIYVDGVYIANLSGGLMAINDIQQIEILKGPQGTLFGRNTTGGVVSISTLTPSRDFSGNAGVSYGNYQTIATTAYVTGGIENLATSLAFYNSNQGQGYGRNFFNGDDVGQTRDLAVRSKTLFTPTNADSITLTMDFERTDSSDLQNMTPIPGSATNFGPGATLAGQRPDMAPYVASGAISAFAQVGNPFIAIAGGNNMDTFANPLTDYRQGGISLRLQHDFSFAHLVSISAYRQSVVDLAWAANAIPADRQFAGWIENEQQFTQELQLVSLDSSRIKWVVGAFDLDGGTRYDPFFITGTSLFPLSSLVFNADQGTKSWAAFAQVTSPVFFVPDTNLTLGVRYTHEKKDILGNTVVTFLPPLGFLNGASGQTDASDSFSKTTFRVALDHHFGDKMLGYASFNTGFKSGYFNMIPPGGPGATAVQPETLAAYELGIKTDFLDSRLRVNAAVFYYKWSDLQVTVYNNTTAITENAARAELYGIDFDVDFKATDQLTLSGGLSPLKDHFLSYPGAQFNTVLPASLGGGTVATSGSAAGNQLPYAPKFTANVAADYALPKLSIGQLAVDVTYYYNNGFYATADNSLRAPSYQLLNSRVDWTSPEGATHVSLWGKNLANKMYATFLNYGSNPGGYEQARIGAPRTYGIAFRRDF